MTIAETSRRYQWNQEDQMTPGFVGGGSLGSYGIEPVNAATTSSPNQLIPMYSRRSFTSSQSTAGFGSFAARPNAASDKRRS